MNRCCELPRDQEKENNELLKKEKKMAEIEIPSATIVMTEQTLRELTKALEGAKDYKLGSEIVVTSRFSKVIFRIVPEIKAHTQESLGYTFSPELSVKRPIAQSLEP